MSDFLAIVAVQGKVIHLVDWDRPCWFSPENPEGERLIPNINYMLTDALLFFAFENFDLPRDVFIGRRQKGQVLDLNDSIEPEGISEARMTLRGKKQPFVLLAHFGNLDSILKADIALFRTPILTAPIEMSQAHKFGIG